MWTNVFCISGGCDGAQITDEFVGATIALEVMDMTRREMEDAGHRTSAVPLVFDPLRSQIGLQRTLTQVVKDHTHMRITKLFENDLRSPSQQRCLLLTQVTNGLASESGTWMNASIKMDFNILPDDSVW